MRAVPRARILAGAALLTLLAACATQPAATPPPAAAPAPAPTTPAAPPLPPPTHPGLTLAAVGDMMLGTDFPENILPDDDGLAFLEAVTPILSKPDVTFGNLEGVLQDGGEPVKQCKDKRICFLFRTPARYATYFKLAGFDVLSLANNHARDFGEVGRSSSSMAALDAVGIHHSGPRRHRREFHRQWPAHRHGGVCAQRGLELTQRSADRAAAGGGPGGETRHRHRVLSRRRRRQRRRSAAFAREIFAGEDRGNVVEFARAMIDAGADIVLGHGPHVVRPLEIYATG